MSTGLPRSVRNCFGLPAFIRLPTPPANKITDTDSIFESFAEGAAVITSDAVDDRGWIGAVAEKARGGVRRDLRVSLVVQFVDAGGGEG